MKYQTVVGIPPNLWIKIYGAVADKIGVKQKWHQGDHFDICLAKRALAIKAGAVEITRRQAGAMTVRRRGTGSLGSPVDAEQWLRDRVVAT